MTDEPTPTAIPQAQEQSILARKMKRAFYGLIVLALVLFISKMMWPLQPGQQPAGTVQTPQIPKTAEPVQPPLPAPAVPLAELPPQTSAPPPPEANDAVRMLDERLSSIEARIKEQAEIDAGESERNAQAWNMVARWQAYDTLKAALTSGADFKSELIRLQTLTVGDSALNKPLETLAFNTTGIATQQELEEIYRAALPEALKTRKSQHENSIIRFVEKHMRGLITIRKIGTSDASGLDAKLIALESALHTTNAMEALKTIEGMDPSAQEAFYPLTERLRARVTAEEALVEIRSQLSRMPDKGVE